MEIQPITLEGRIVRLEWPAVREALKRRMDGPHPEKAARGR
jgi:hypothetical protein